MVLYKADSPPEADLGDLIIEVVGPGQRLNREQREFLRRHMPALNIWHLLRLRARGMRWAFLVRSGSEIAHYNLVGPARLYRGKFPIITEPKALMVVFCLTEERFRGRSIYPRTLRYVVNFLSRQGFGPFYIFTNTTNRASIRGMEKAGFIRRGVWAGRRTVLNLWVKSRRVGD